MVRSLGILRLAGGLAVIPFSAVLASACGGSDIVDPADASAFDSSSSDALGADVRIGDGGSPDGDASTGDGGNPDAGDASTRDTSTDTASSDTGSTDSTSSDTGSTDSTSSDTGQPDVDAAPRDAAADARPDADAASIDSGTTFLMQSLGSAQPFVVLGAATITNSGLSTVLIGDIGTTGPMVSGLTGPPFQPSGNTEVNNARASQALLDVGTAYTTLAGRACPPANDLTGTDLGGKTLAPGVYCFSSGAGQLSATTLTFDAQGDPNAVWIIQVGTQLTIMDNATAVVIGGLPSLACRIFWTTGTAAVINGGAHFLGNVIASSQTSMLTNATLAPGRAFGLTSGVTLLSNTISAAACP